MKNGIIGIQCSSRKAIDLKITNSLPMIALQKKSKLVSLGHSIIDTSGYRHFSIPSDLCLHLTKRTSEMNRSEYIFFESPTLDSILNSPSFSYQLIFTYIGQPVHQTPKFNGTWEQAVIISPFPDSEYDEMRTRVFVDFFVHTKECSDVLISFPYSADNMRLAYDRTGPIFGPFMFNGLQRKPCVKSSLLFSIRYGYAEFPVNNDSHLLVPYPIRERRAD